MNTSSITKKISLAAVAILCMLFSFAQDKVEMADTFRSNGKIYVVVAVCLTILIGLFIYVTTLDRKLRRMEKEMKNEN
ncbi:MAG TPA: hypothetical protein PK504_08570 [Ferruginibacter sp.]|nr:hypothetical protein [Ferruginibacter sp.]HRE62592.1 hypothetical protein [Ferruginibacter sp.]